LPDWFLLLLLLLPPLRLPLLLLLLPLLLLVVLLLLPLLLLQAVLALQRRCPQARVMYVSATGATEAENLCYMERLGLWGQGTSFGTRAEFVQLLNKRGVGG
jgi:hypothetical protein